MQPTTPTLPSFQASLPRVASAASAFQAFQVQQASGNGKGLYSRKHGLSANPVTPSFWILTFQDSLLRQVYPPSTIHQLLCGLLRHMRNTNPGCPNLHSMLPKQSKLRKWDYSLRSSRHRDPTTPGRYPKTPDHRLKHFRHSIHLKSYMSNLKWSHCIPVKKQEIDALFYLRPLPSTPKLHGMQRYPLDGDWCPLLSSSTTIYSQAPWYAKVYPLDETHSILLKSACRLVCCDPSPQCI